MRNKKKILFLGLLLLASWISILVISIIKESKNAGIYVAIVLMAIISTYLLVIVFLDDSLDKKKLKVMIDEVNKNKEKLKFSKLDTLYCSIFLSFENETYSYVEILNKHISIAKYNVEETNKIKEAQKITDVNLKNEALYEILKNKSFEKISTKKLRIDEIIDLIIKKLEE